MQLVRLVPRCLSRAVLLCPQNKSADDVSLRSCLYRFKPITCALPFLLVTRLDFARLFLLSTIGYIMT